MSLRLPVATCAVLAAACTVTRESPRLVGQDVRLTFIHTSDIHSRLFPYHFIPNRFDQDYGLRPSRAPFGGAARMATIVKEQRARAARSLWLDSGDCFQGAPVFNMFKGEAELRALSRMGMDGAVIGNHEFNLGAQNLYEQIANWAEFPLLAANYEFEDPLNPQRKSLQDVVQPYVIYDVDGLKVGVIGMANWSSMTGIFEGGNSLGIRPRVDAQVVSEYVRLLRPVVDVVVLVSHLGLDEDEGLSSNDVVDENEALPLEGVDLVLGGHLHIVLNPPKTIPNDTLGHQTIMVHSGAFAKYVGRLDVVVRVGENNGDPTRRSQITAFAYDNLPVDSTVPDDPEIAELLWPYSVALNREIDLGGVFAYVATPGDDKIIRNDLTGGDSQLGNLVARSMQLRTGIEAEIAITNSLGIRADFEQGPLTIEAMYNVFPFENSIAIIYLSGSELLETLDFIAQKSSERGCRSQAQVAGIAFDMVCAGDCPGDATACAKNVHIGEDCRGGMPDGPIDPSRCPPLAPTGLYKVAVNDYIANGGSGFEVLKRNTSKQFTTISLRDALTDFLRNQTPCGDGVVDATDADGDTVVDNWGPISCLDSTLEAHDGRIRPTFSSRAKLALALALAALGAACTEELAPITGTTSLAITLIAPDPGTADARLDPSIDTITVQVTALDARGQLDEDFTGDVDAYAHFLGGLSPELGASAGPLAALHLEEGVSAEIDITLPNVYGPTFLWLEDGARADASFATGTSPVLWFRDPFLEDVSRPLDETVGQGALERSPLEQKQINVTASRHGAQGRLVVTGIYAQGYTLSDVVCVDADGNPPCTTDDYDSIFVFSFNRPVAEDGTDLEVGDTIAQLTGAIGEFNGLTEVNFPQSFRGPEHDPDRVPPPAVLVDDWLESKIEMERLESSLLRVVAAEVCPLDDDFMMYGQWKLDVGSGCDESGQMINVITKGQVNEFVPGDHVGEVIDVTGTLRPVNISKGGFNVWILYPRSIDDLVLP